MRLYEEAIRAARENGFVQNEGIANELAAQFYLKRGIEKIGAFLPAGRALLLSSLGRTGQGAAARPALSCDHEEQASLRPATTIGTSVEQLDLGTVMKASHAVSGEIVLEKLIETLMVIAARTRWCRARPSDPAAWRRASDRCGSQDRPRRGRGPTADSAGDALRLARLAVSLRGPNSGERDSG